MNKGLKLALEYGCLFVLAMCMALNYEMFIFCNSFAPSGISGIATMVQYLFDISVGYMTLLVNVPLAVCAFFLVDRDFTLKSLFFVTVFSFALIFLKGIDMSAYQYYTENGTSTILAPVAAGTINGAIYGAALKIGGSTGGTDFIAACIRKKKPYISLMWIIFTLNVAVACISYFVYGYKFEPVILCIIYCFITSSVSDKILKGGKEAIKFEVVTSHAEELSEMLISKLHHGVTVLDAEGMYLHKEENMLVCVVNKHQIVDFQKIIKQYPDTFAYISSVSETVGNFKQVR